MKEYIPLTFKEDERWLYEEICKHSSKGGFIKDILKQYLQPEKKKEESKSSLDDILKGM